MFLYCISNDNGMCKFGFSGEPLKRLRALQTGSSDTLHLIETVGVPRHRVRELERVLHKEIGMHRRVRGEWFAVDAEEGASLLQWFAIRYSEDCE